MKKVIIPFVLTAIAVVAIMLIPNNSEAASSKTSFKASITCDGCKNKIEKSMKEVDGVNSTEVDVETKTVNFDYNPEVVTIATLKNKVSDLGYEVSEIKAKQCSTKDKECSTSEAKDGEKCNSSNKKLTSNDCGSDEKCCKDKVKK